MSVDHTLTLVNVDVISTRHLNIIRERGQSMYGVAQIAVQVLIQEYDWATKSFIYGKELWTDVKAGAVQQNFNAGEMQFYVRKPADTKLIFVVSNLDEKNLTYRFCGELRIAVSKLTPEALPVTDTFNLDASPCFPRRQITGELTVSIKLSPGAPPAC